MFNRKLCKHLKAFNNTQMVEGGSNRDYYTRHGLHLNQKGKEQMARNIAWAIKDRLNVQKCTPIIMSQCLIEATTKNDQAETTNTYYDDKEHKLIQMTANHYETSNVRASLRHKKPPKLLTENFLW